MIYYYIIPCVLMVFDVVTGTLQAIVNKCLSSTKAREGLYHKTSLILLLALSSFLTWAQGYIDLEINIPLLQATSIYICITEIISNFENIKKINPEIAEFIDKYLKRG